MLNKSKIGILLKKGGSLPVKGSEEASGYDLCSNMDTIIPHGEYKKVTTGVYLDLPKGTEAQIRPRSGLAAKYGITVLNSPGTIDSDYRGEICVLLINHGKNDFKIEQGMRIAQMVFSRIIETELVIKSELSESNRGEKGFGSTGIYQIK